MLLIVTMGSQPHVAVLARGLVLLSRSSLGAPSMGSTRALAVALQTWWPQPLARVLAMARWRSWNRELEKAEAEEQAELEKQREDAASGAPQEQVVIVMLRPHESLSVSLLVEGMHIPITRLVMLTFWLEATRWGSGEGCPLA